MPIKYDSVEESLSYLDGSLSGLDVYEFGVFSGNTLGRIISGFRDRNIEVRQFWGLDSFKGLPAEDPNVWQNSEWPEGAFNVQKDFGLQSTKAAIEFVYGNIRKVNLDKNVTLIPGYFSETCNKITYKKANMFPAQYIHVDCDIYRSSEEVLRFVFDNQIVVPGTLVRFDDISSTPRNGGQHLAWDRAKSRYSIQFEQLSYNVFRILSYKTRVI